MSDFYYKKYYCHKGNDSRFYIPLQSIKVDIDRLKNEIYEHVDCENVFTNKGYAITTTEQFIDEYPLRPHRYNIRTFPDHTGEQFLPYGNRDEDVVYWPKIFENSYMKELSLIFSDIVKIKNPRVRMSVQTHFPHHIDIHTPYRLHIALETYPDAVWNFRDKNNIEHEIHQPANGIPVLIDSGDTMHSVILKKTLPNLRRVHLWYQFHGIISDDILKNL